MKIASINKKQYCELARIVPRDVYDTLMTQNTSVVAAISDYGQIKGTIIARMEEYHVELIWFYVEEKSRNLGIGSMLMNQMLIAVMNMGFIASIYTIYKSDRVSDHVLRMLAKYGFEYRYNGIEIRKGELLDMEAQLKGQIPADYKVMPLESLDQKQQEYIKADLRGFYGESVDDRLEIYNGALSAIAFRKEKIEGYVLVSDGTDGYVVDFVHMIKKDFKALMAALMYAYQRAEKEKDRDNPTVTVLCINEESSNLARYILPNGESTNQGIMELRLRAIDETLLQV